MRSAAASVTRPFAPSWVDRLTEVLARSPVPRWVVYVAVAVLSIPIFIAADVMSADFPLATVLPFHGFLAALPALTLWFMDYLDRAAEKALDQARPVLNTSDDAFARLRYELITMPARPVLLLTVLGVVAIPVILAVVFALDREDQLLTVLGMTRGSLSLAAFAFFIALSWAVGFLFLYHAVRQLRLISHIYAHYVTVDLANLGPLYSFSRVSALTAAGMQLQSVLWIATNPAAGGAFVPTVFLIVLTFVAAVIFTLPLWGIHRRIADEKGRRLGENAHGREALMVRLRGGVDVDDLARATQIKDALLAYDVEAKALAGTRTWPWEPETLRLLLTAVLLPVALFLLQYVLRQFLPS